MSLLMPLKIYAGVLSWGRCQWCTDMEILQSWSNPKL